ncbi:MAG: MATE family efflux transporter [Spirochaetes bacterium]|nr:MATE family efflux transporter [Spirochaetota bacterium]MBN2770121.1 MATE family efflux transporter [Spirochaetota bacterium]
MIDMTKGNPLGLIVRFSIPMFAGSVFQQLYNVADSVVVGRFLGKNALAAVGASFPIMFLLIALSMGATMGISVMISQYYGARDYKKVKLCIETSYIFLVIIALIVTVMGLVLDDVIINILNTPSEIYADTRLYIDILFGGLILMFGYNSISAVLRGLGDSKTPLYLLIFATVLNIVLDLVFVICFGWGVAGVAIATVLAQGISFIGGIIYLQKINPLFAVNYLKLRFDKDIFVKSIKIGLPTGAQQMFVAAGMMALTRIVNQFGTNALAAFTAAARIDSFAVMPAMNFSLAMSTFVGQNIGAGKLERVNSAIRIGLIFAVFCALTVSLSVICFSNQLMLLFTSDVEVISIGQEYLFIVSGFYIAFMIMFIFNGALRGAGDTIIPMFITLFSLWLIRIPVATYFSVKMGTRGIWLGIPIAWVLGAIFSCIYFLTGRWRRKSVVRAEKVDVDSVELVNDIECLEMEKKECRL